MSADVLRERWKSDDERKARVLRLIVRGKPGVAQGQIEAAARRGAAVPAPVRPRGREGVMLEHVKTGAALVALWALALWLMVTGRGRMSTEDEQ